MKQVSRSTTDHEKQHVAQAHEKIKELNSNGKKTIAFFCDVFYPSLDGVISVLHNIAVQMSKFFNVVVCVPKYKGKTVAKDEYLVLGAKSIYVPGLKYTYSPFPSQDKKFCSLISELKVDLVHFHSPFAMGKFAAKFAKARGIPAVTTFHSQYALDFKAVTKSKAITEIMLSNIVKVFNMADTVLTMYEFSKQVAISYGVKRPFHLIPNGTNMKTLENPSEIKAAEKKYGLKKDVPFLLSVGRLVRVKNLDLMIEAFKILKSKNFNFSALIVGSGSLLRRLKQKAEKLGVSENISFIGLITRRTELEALFQRADLFLLPSVYETASLVRVEAAVQGTATLAIAGTVSASLIKNGENGFICDNDPNSFAEKILEIFSDRKNLQKASVNAQKDLSVYWDDVALDYKTFYEKKMNP